MMDKYVAIIGDIVNSKNIDNRSEVQYQLKNIVECLNLKYQNDIMFNLRISLGDEVQGVFRLGGNIISVIEDLEMMMYPVRMRFGIGVGEVDEDYVSDNTLEMDGSAYHYARAMISAIKNQELKNSDSFTFVKFNSDSNVDNIINSIFILASTLKIKWTSRQREVITTYIMSDENQYQTAEKLEIDQSTVNRSLKASNYYNYRDAITKLKLFLEDLEVEKHG